MTYWTLIYSDGTTITVSKGNTVDEWNAAPGVNVQFLIEEINGIRKVTSGQDDYNLGLSGANTKTGLEISSQAWIDVRNFMVAGDY